MNNTKIIAMYLPQYHQIVENDTFWGKGFTDWTTVKNATPLFEGHNQPRVPLNEKYYDLSQKENIVWQTQLAKENGIYGFGIYHYWFNNEKNLLTKPSEIIRDNDDIKINYCFAWDNVSWKRSWDNVKEEGNAWAPKMDVNKKGPSILIPYILGQEKDWDNHYNYVKSFFKDDRYIKINNCPVFIIFHYSSEIKKMCEYWKQKALADGFDGIYFIFRYDRYLKIPSSEKVFKYEPQFSGWSKKACVIIRAFKKIMVKVRPVCPKYKKYDYDELWQKILSNARTMNSENIYHGAFVAYDDTPRRGNRGIVVSGEGALKFKKNMSELLRLSSEQKKDFIFLTAWNEWGEGAYLEPDNKNGFSYLNVLKELK